VPSKFNTILEAVKLIARLLENTGEFRTPSVALKLAHNLRKLGAINRLNCIKNKAVPHYRTPSTSYS